MSGENRCSNEESCSVQNGRVWTAGRRHGGSQGRRVLGWRRPRSGCRTGAGAGSFRWEEYLKSNHFAAFATFFYPDLGEMHRNLKCYFTVTEQRKAAEVARCGF